ncbi:MAG: DUF3685 domain-containing protein [Thainema sp.]
MSNRPANIVLLDHDPVFRLGLRIWLEQYADLRMVAECQTGSEVLQLLAEVQAEGARGADGARASASEPIVDALEEISGRTADSSESDRLTADAAGIDLVITDLVANESDPREVPGLVLCQRIKQLFPNIKVLILSDRNEPVIEAAARRVQADGYCWRQQPVSELASIIRQVAQGAAVWPQVLPDAELEQSPTVTAQSGAAGRTGRVPVRRSWWQQVRQSARQSGLREIDAEINRLQAQLQRALLLDIDPDRLAVLVIEGRLRELRTARWIVTRLLATPRASTVLLEEPSATPTQRLDRPNRFTRRQIADRSSPNPSTINSANNPANNLPNTSDSAAAEPDAALISQPATSLRTIPSFTVDAAFNRLQGSLRNLTRSPLEIDILRRDRKRELLYIILRSLIQVLDDLQQAQITTGQLAENQLAYLKEVWAKAVNEFYGRYYMVQVSTVEQALVQVILQDEAVVQRDILEQIPLVGELLSYLLFQTPLMVDGVPSGSASPQAQQQAQLLLDNLLLQMANAVVQPLLNRFADVEAVKRDFYDVRLLSTREIERFRNDLSWRYRQQRYIKEPTAIFESRYRLLSLAPEGIRPASMYAPRRAELEQLEGIPYVVTLSLEFRDAVAPRLRSLISFVGSGLIYVLTDVIGRSIGLVIRGVLQGIGSAWQDVRFGRNDKRQRQDG